MSLCVNCEDRKINVRKRMLCMRCYNHERLNDGEPWIKNNFRSMCFCGKMVKCKILANIGETTRHIKVCSIHYDQIKYHGKDNWRCQVKNCFNPPFKGFTFCKVCVKERMK